MNQQQRKHNHDFGRYTYDNQTPRVTNPGFRNFLTFSTKSRFRSRLIFWSILFFIVSAIVGAIDIVSFFWSLIF